MCLVFVYARSYPVGYLVIYAKDIPARLFLVQVVLLSKRSIFIVFTATTRPRIDENKGGFPERIVLP